jgi:hypothetical protein
MASLTREQILETIQADWGGYVEHFQSLSPQAQAAFLAKQGYARLADLLAHVIAWWEVGYQAITTLLADPDFHELDYDVDVFNAQAVQRFSNLDEAATLKAFETQRTAMFDLVAHMPEAAFQNQQIIDRLHIEFIGHLREHELPHQS